MVGADFYKNTFNSFTDEQKRRVIRLVLDDPNSPYTRKRNRGGADAAWSQRGLRLTYDQLLASAKASQLFANNDEFEMIEDEMSEQAMLDLKVFFNEKILAVHNEANQNGAGYRKKRTRRNRRRRSYKKRR